MTYNVVFVRSSLFLELTWLIRCGGESKSFLKGLICFSRTLGPLGVFIGAEALKIQKKAEVCVVSKTRSQTTSASTPNKVTILKKCFQTFASSGTCSSSEASDIVGPHTTDSIKSLGGDLQHGDGASGMVTWCWTR